MPHEKSCIICNQAKCGGDTRKISICETRRAKQFLSAIRFNKDDAILIKQDARCINYKMHYKECITRCIPYNTVGYSFVEDVMNHKNCMTKYIIKFQRDFSDTFDDNLNILRLVWLEKHFFKWLLNLKKGLCNF